MEPLLHHTKLLSLISLWLQSIKLFICLVFIQRVVISHDTWRLGHNVELEAELELPTKIKQQK